MSRAFVKEDDGSRPEVLPELPVSSAPNLVTARGLRLIAARIAELEAALAADARRGSGARLRRDLRYWSAAPRHRAADRARPGRSRRCSSAAASPTAPRTARPAP